VIGGFGFGYSAFLNGVFLGSNQGSATVFQTTDVWSVPANTLQIGKDNVLTVIQGERIVGHLRMVFTDGDDSLDHMG
jgi:hypothetical protein